jgi:hypothetical protein
MHTTYIYTSLREMDGIMVLNSWIVYASTVILSVEGRKRVMLWLEFGSLYEFGSEFWKTYLPARFCTSKLGVRAIIGVLQFTQTVPLQVFTQRWMKTNMKIMTSQGWPTTPFVSFVCVLQRRPTTFVRTAPSPPWSELWYMHGFSILF